LLPVFKKMGSIAAPRKTAPVKAPDIPTIRLALLEALGPSTLTSGATRPVFSHATAVTRGARRYGHDDRAIYDKKRVFYPVHVEYFWRR
jgi:hypothetical protein